MQRFIVYVYFIKFIGITHFVYSGILLLYLIKQHIHQPFIRQWGKYDINVTKDYTYANINLPLTCNLNEPLFIVPSIMCNHENNTKDFNIQCSGYSTNTISFVIRCLSTTLDNFTFKWCIISK